MISRFDIGAERPSSSVGGNLLGWLTSVKGVADTRTTMQGDGCQLEPRRHESELPIGAVWGSEIDWLPSTSRFSYVLWLKNAIFKPAADLLFSARSLSQPQAGTCRHFASSYSRSRITIPNSLSLVMFLKGFTCLLFTSLFLFPLRPREPATKATTSKDA